jgi:hypothetical protein
MREINSALTTGPNTSEAPANSTTTRHDFGKMPADQPRQREHDRRRALGELGAAGSLESRARIMLDVRLPFVEPLLALGDGRNDRRSARRAIGPLAPPERLAHLFRGSESRRQMLGFTAEILGTWRGCGAGFFA